MMSVSFSMAYRSFWKFWQALTPATIRRLLKPRHPFPSIAPFAGNLDLLNMAIKEWIGLVVYSLTGRTPALLPKNC